MYQYASQEIPHQHAHLFGLGVTAELRVEVVPQPRQQKPHLTPLLALTMVLSAAPLPVRCQ